MRLMRYMTVAGSILPSQSSTGSIVTDFLKRAFATYSQLDNFLWWPKLCDPDIASTAVTLIPLLSPTMQSLTVKIPFKLPPLPVPKVSTNVMGDLNSIREEEEDMQQGSEDQVLEQILEGMPDYEPLPVSYDP